jgi:DNA-binding IclR family transcriptional regulator
MSRATEGGRTQTIEASAKTLEILEMLLRADVVHGLSPTDLARSTGLTAPTVTRHLATLEGRRFAERIPETGRIRVALRVLQYATAAQLSLDRATQRVTEIRSRISTPL